MGSFALLVIMAILFTAVLAVGQSVYWALLLKKEGEKAELARRLGTTTEDDFQKLFREGAKDAAAMALGKIGDNLQETINQADSSITVTNLLTRMGIGLVVGSIGGLVFLGSFGLVVGLLGALIPYMILKQQGSSRAYKLLEQLPEALDLMARSLQAGLGLNDAFKMCAEELHMPVAGEFGRVFEEVRFGREYRDALNNLVRRNPAIFDLRLFVSSVLLQRETGGNLIEILENIATTIRQRFLFAAKLKAMTAEAKFTALVLGALPLFVGGMVSYINPSYLAPLFTTLMGNIIAGGAATMYLTGVGLMVWMSKVEV